MKQTPLRLLAIAAATALVFTACGGGDDNNAPSGYYPGGGTGGGYGGTPNPGGNPYWHNPTPTPTDTGTPSDTSSSDSGSDTTDTSDTSDACADPSSTDTACVPTGVALETKSKDKQTLPVHLTGSEVTISLEPKLKRAVQVEVDDSKSATSGAKVSDGVGFASDDGTKTVKVIVPEQVGNPGRPLVLKVTDTATGKVVPVTSPLGGELHVCEASNPDAICAPTGAILTAPAQPKVKNNGLTSVTITLTPTEAREDVEIAITRDDTTGGAQIKYGATTDSKVVVPFGPGGYVSFELDVGPSSTGEEIVLGLTDKSGQPIKDFILTVE